MNPAKWNLKQRLLLATSLLLFIFAAGYSALCVYFYQAVPSPKVDYAQSLNYKNVDVPESEHAWPIYRESLLRHQERFYLFRDGNMYSAPFCLVSPNDGEKWRQAVHEIKDLEPLLNDVNRASRLPVLGFDVFSSLADYSPTDQTLLQGGFLEGGTTQVVQRKKRYSNRVVEFAKRMESSIPSEHLYLLRDFVCLLRIELNIAIENGEIDRAVQAVESSFGVAHQAANLKWEQESVVSVKLWATSLESLQILLNSCAGILDDFQRARLIAALNRSDLYELYEPWNSVLGNRDRLQHFFTDDGNRNGHLNNHWYHILEFIDEGRAEEVKFFRSPSSLLDSTLRLFTKPFIVLVGPSRLMVERQLDRQEKLLRDIWQSPYDHDKIETTIAAIRAEEVILGIENDYSLYLRYFNEIVSLEAERNKIHHSLE